jgi:hypothetical protein
MPSTDDPGATTLLLSMADIWLPDQRRDEGLDILIAAFKSSEG